MELRMKRAFILSAIVALSAIAATAGVAQTSNLSTADQEICRILELAHESNCAEYESTLARQYAAAGADEQKSA